MQNAAFEAAGLDWTYELLDVSAADLPAAVERLRAADVGGANVTIPHKQAVISRLDGVDPDALRSHAVNTIVREGERLLGSNTDVIGVRAALSEVGLEPKGANVVILGGGGAARAAAVALAGAHLTFVSRHPEDDDLPGAVIGWTDPALAALTRTSDLLLNATPLGRKEEMPVRPASLPKDGAVIDLVYVTGGTPLVRKARSLGLRTADGWGVLLAQGAAAFEVWTGKAAPLVAMRQTLAP
jgi:shikimate dehydrogenase